MEYKSLTKTNVGLPEQKLSNRGPYEVLGGLLKSLKKNSGKWKC